MKSHSLAEVPDAVLLRDGRAAFDTVATRTADALTYLGEIDERQLYLPAAYPSLFAFCVGEWHLDEDAAYKYIRAARMGRRFPGILPALAEGRLHLSAVVLLAPHLTAETEAELIAAATHKSKREVEQLLAERFPRFAVPAGIETVSGPPVSSQLAPGPVEELGAQLAPGPVQPERPARVTPLASESFAVQFTMDQAMHDDLRYAQSLLGHQVPSGDLAAVFKRSLRALVTHLEKQKFAATSRPRPSRQARPGTRYVPAHVRRPVWERDGGQCTFVSEAGKRCPARERLEFDHVEAFARGGEATVAGIRLRCRAHNQYQAEQTFGAGFMRQKREATRAAKARQKPKSPARVDDDMDLTPWLRELGYRADQARWAAEKCAEMPAEASLEDRMRAALRMFRPKTGAHLPRMK